MCIISQSLDRERIKRSGSPDSRNERESRRSSHFRPPKWNLFCVHGFHDIKGA